MLKPKQLLLTNYQAKSADYTVVAGDRNSILSVSASGAARAITLPSAATVGAGFQVEIEKSDSSANAVTISRVGSDTIQGANSLALYSQYQRLQLVSDGTSRWLIYPYSGSTFPAYPFASLPSASAAGAGAIAYCSDVGHGCYLRSDGTYWRPAWAQTIYASTTQVDYTGGTTVQYLVPFLLPGGFVHPNAVFRCTIIGSRSAGAGGNVTVIIRVGATNNAGSTAIYQNGATALQVNQRYLIFQNSLSTQISPIPGNNSSYAAGGSNPSNLGYNFASDQYITGCVQLANGADTGTIYGFLVEYLK